MHDVHEHSCHDHAGMRREQPAGKDKLVLEYLIEHNRQHTSELNAIADKFDETGDKDAAASIRDAAGAYAIGNDKLANALTKL